jgi:uncharacterized protein YidB (DUF937 family)
MAIERNIDPNAKVGLRIKLIKMGDDDWAPIDEDMEGTIFHVDSIGTIHVNWDDGRTLGVIPNVDEYVLYPPSDQVIDDLDDVFNESSLTSLGKDKAVINKSMPKSTLRGAKSTKGGQKVNKNFKSSLNKAKVRDIKVEDEIKGGKADKLTPKKLADKHGVSVEDIEKEIKIGMEIETEHSYSNKKKREIAMDHLAEFPDYYSNKRYGLETMEKGLEKVHEGFKDWFKKKATFDPATDYVRTKRFIRSVKKINDSITDATPQQIGTLKKMVDNLEAKYEGYVADEELFNTLISKLREKIDSKYDLDETTMAGGGASTGAFVGPLDGPVKRDKIYEPKNENRVIKVKDLMNEIVDTKITKIRDAGSGYDANPWVGDKKEDGWNFNDEPAWEGGEIVDMLAKLDINWVDGNLTVDTIKEAVKKGKDIHKAKWKRCVEKVKKNSPDVNPYAVCTDSIGYEGSIKKKHRRKDEMSEEELDETTTFGSVWGGDGPPVTPTFAAKPGQHVPSKKSIYKGGRIVQKIKNSGVMTEENTIKWVKGGKFVKIKDKCAKYRNNEHCNQGAIDDPLELSDTTFKNVQEVAKKLGISEQDVINKLRKKLNEDKVHKLSLKDRLKIKLAGISDDQVIYNLNNGLPIDWKGTKEGYYEKQGEGNKGYSGSD